ncbi:MAG TPA: GNAT family N-acetyltransferase [Tepidisphaeraceae bacterium]|nr:GNAT family N-acetyltransferase [Tepidisphaeraceae bacterium]
MSDSSATSTPVTIRSFKRDDLPTCSKLYREGLVGGRIAENDTGLDIDDIEQAYMNSPESHFWVAQGDDGEVWGMIGVQGHEEGVGEIRRLRVAQEHRRRGIGSALVEQALKFCKDRGYIKIALDTFMEREPAIRLFEKFHFRHSRTRQVNSKEILHFYLDLYQSDAPAAKKKK